MRFAVPHLIDAVAITIGAANPAAVPDQAWVAALADLRLDATTELPVLAPPKPDPEPAKAAA